MSEELKRETMTDKQANELVWAEIKPKLWAAAMGVLGVIAIGCTMTAMLGGGGSFAFSWMIGAAVSATGAAVSWYQEQKAEKELLIREQHIASSVEAKQLAGAMIEADRVRDLPQKERDEYHAGNQVTDTGVSPAAAGVGTGGYEQNQRADGEKWQTVVRPNGASQPLASNIVGDEQTEEIPSVSGGRGA